MNLIRKKGLTHLFMENREVFIICCSSVNPSLLFCSALSVIRITALKRLLSSFFYYNRSSSALLPEQPAFSLFPEQQDFRSFAEEAISLILSLLGEVPRFSRHKGYQTDKAFFFQLMADVFESAVGFSFIGNDTVVRHGGNMQEPFVR